MKVSIADYEAYLYDHYKSHGVDSSLFMKLVEEVGEVAEVLNKRDGRKAFDREDLQEQLANELVDVIHYAVAIAALNHIDLNDVMLEKDKKASIKYHHERNLEQFLLER
jgi:NTP pyrophosphatase (non-canonical NTP hydrolase)